LLLVAAAERRGKGNETSGEERKGERDERRGEGCFWSRAILAFCKDFSAKKV
jgi:hypothetical protein